jgi:hypothetical protein
MHAASTSHDRPEFTGKRRKAAFKINSTRTSALHGSAGVKAVAGEFQGSETRKKAKMVVGSGFEPEKA